MRAVSFLFVLSLLAPEAALSQLSVTIYPGLYLPDNADLHLRQAAFHTDLWLRDVPFRGRSLETPFYYGIRVGIPVSVLRRAKCWAELEFVHAKAYAKESAVVDVSGEWEGARLELRAPFNRFVQSFSLSHGLNLVMGNLVVPFFRRSGFALGLRIGAGAAVPHVENRVRGHWVQRYQLAGLCYQVGVAADWRLRRGFYLDAALRLTRADLSRLDTYRGSISAVMDGVHVNVGVLMVVKGRGE